LGPEGAGVLRAKRAMSIGALLWRLTRAVVTYRWLTFGLTAAILFEVGVELGAQASLKYFIDEGLVARNARVIGLLMVALALAAVVGAAVGFVRDYLTAWVETAVLRDLQQRMFEHLQRLSLSFYARTQVGDLMARFSTDLAQIESALYTCLGAGGITSLFTVLFGMPTLFWLDYRLALVGVVGGPFVVLSGWWLTPRAASAAYDVQRSQGALQSKVQETISAQATVKAFGLGGAERQNFAARLATYFRTNLRANLLGYIVYRAPHASLQLLAVAVLATGALFILRGTLTVGALVAFNAMLTGVVNAAGDLAGRVPTLLHSAAGMTRIDEILDTDPEVVDAPDARALPPLCDGIELRDVRLRYGDRSEALRGINMHIPKGSYVALVGPSGSGKTTVLNLLLRLYDPDEGSVMFDGHSLREVTEASLRSQVRAVLQEPFLLNTSVRENVRLGRPQATDEEIVDASIAAGLHETALALESGYDTIVGERGQNLAVGERQRVSIARALLSDPRVLVLDEATASLDATTEAAVLQTVRSLTPERTVVFVTHRLKVAADADMIYVLRRGRIVEQGPHEELLRAHGEYKRLWDHQAATMSLRPAPPSSASVLP
jgi:ATP-binding cassette subfamily B protein